MDAWKGHKVFGRGGQVPFRNPATGTGMSMVSGDPVTGVADLPDHRVEVHVFNNADTASSFVSGLETAGVGNTMDYTWEVGDTTSNRVVFVARFDEERPSGDTLDEALPSVVHASTGHDGRAIAAYTKRLTEERAAADRSHALEAAPFFDALAAVGFEKSGHGNGWLRAHRGRQGVSVNWGRGHAGVSVFMDCQELLQGSLDVSREVVAAAEGHGIALDLDERRLHQAGLAGPSEAAECATRMVAALRSCEEAKSAVWEAAFRASMKMTAARRRFLKAGAEFGIGTYVRRANRRAHAGGEDIAVSEINSLLRIGWIEDGGRGYVVTEAGKEAAGVDVKASPAPR